RAGVLFRQTRQSLRNFRTANDTGIQLVLARMVEPAFKTRHIRGGFGEIHDAGAAEAGFGRDHLVHALPQPQTFDGQRKITRITHHLAAPAPVTARLLTGNLPLFAQRHRYAPLSQEQGRAGADDPAADDDHIDTAGLALIGADRIDAWCHALLLAGSRFIEAAAMA